MIDPMMPSRPDNHWHDDPAPIVAVVSILTIFILFFVFFLFLARETPRQTSEVNPPIVVTVQPVNSPVSR